MSTPTREVILQEAIRQWLKRLPFTVKVRKLADRFTRGYPDLQAIFAYEGQLVLLEIECKSKTGKVDALQEAEAKECEKASFEAIHGKYIHCVARSLDDVKQALAKRGIFFGDSGPRKVPPL